MLFTVELEPGAGREGSGGEGKEKEGTNEEQNQQN